MINALLHIVTGDLGGLIEGLSSARYTMLLARDTSCIGCRLELALPFTALALPATERSFSDLSALGWLST